jgi:DNA-binding GntR family transcriptional regulator
VSGESLVIVLFGVWLLATAAVLGPTFLPGRTKELRGPARGPAFLEDFVEAVARGDFDAAEQAAASVFSSSRHAVTVGFDPAPPSTA